MSSQKKEASFADVVTTLRPELQSKAVLEGAQTLWSSMAVWQREMADFVSDRLAKDAEAVKETLSCRNWTDALAIQTRWVDQTLRDYNGQITKLTRLYAKGASWAGRTEQEGS